MGSAFIGTVIENQKLVMGDVIGFHLIFPVREAGSFPEPIRKIIAVNLSGLTASSNRERIQVNVLCLTDRERVYEGRHGSCV